MKTIELTETGPKRGVDVALTPDQGRRLASSGVVGAAPSPHDARLWRISAKAKVGVVRIGDVDVRIEPKLPIERLLFLVGYAADPAGWRDELGLVDVRPGLVPATAQLLWRQIEQAISPGLLHGYRSVEESSATLRGRIHQAEQVRRHHGRAYPVAIQYDDLTADIAENQILLAAVTRMLRVPRIDEHARKHLLSQRQRLSEFTTVVRQKLPKWQPSRFNERYHRAVRLAEIVWRATSPEHAPGVLETNGFLFDLNRIFEAFVTNAIDEHIRARFDGRAYLQYPCHLDEQSTVSMKPDLAWLVRGEAVAVLDAKYKQERPSGFPNADVYQMLAYCVALNLPRGHLVYAAGNADPTIHTIRRSNVEIVCHALDLAQDPGCLLDQVGQLVAQLRRK